MSAKTSKTILNIVLGGLFAAVIAVMTGLVPHIPIGATGGYLHFGDAFIFLAASFLPWPYALAAAAIGGGLADVLAGAPEWALYTVVIKALIALCFTAKREKLLNVHNWLALLFAWLISVGGYYLAEAFIYGNWVAPVASIPGNCIQALGSSIIFVLAALLLDRLGFKKRFRL
ncbi:MAG: TIGR04002 family protein [Clostridiales bacterium]|nr:TIGR04002 family protein [Clostridiales bacterium]